VSGLGDKFKPLALEMLKEYEKIAQAHNTSFPLNKLAPYKEQPSPSQSTAASAPPHQRRIQEARARIDARASSSGQAGETGSMGEGGASDDGEEQPLVLSKDTRLPSGSACLSALAKKLLKANMFAKKRSLPAFDSSDPASVDLVESEASSICSMLQVVGVSEEEWGGSAFASSLKRARLS